MATFAMRYAAAPASMAAPVAGDGKRSEEEEMSKLALQASLPSFWKKGKQDRKRR